MMTIKHIHDTGEYLVEGSDVQFYDGNVHYTAPSGQIKELDRAPGVAYVMNQYGATVATYQVNQPTRAPAQATFQSEVNSGRRGFGDLDSIHT